MGSITGYKIDYNGAGALRGQRHIPSKTKPKYPPPFPPGFHPALHQEKEIGCQPYNRTDQSERVTYTATQWYLNTDYGHGVFNIRRLRTPHISLTYSAIYVTSCVGKKNATNQDQSNFSAIKLCFIVNMLNS